MIFLVRTIVVQTTVQLGDPESILVPLGIVLLAWTVLSVNPRPSARGALLLTGLSGRRRRHQRAVSTGLCAMLFPGIYGALL
jgi:hypothetical protein